MGSKLKTVLYTVGKHLSFMVKTNLESVPEQLNHEILVRHEEAHMQNDFLILGHFHAGCTYNTYTATRPSYDRIGNFFTCGQTQPESRVSHWCCTQNAYRLRWHCKPAIQFYTVHKVIIQHCTWYVGLWVCTYVCIFLYVIWKTLHRGSLLNVSWYIFCDSVRTVTVLICILLVFQ